MAFAVHEPSGLLEYHAGFGITDDGDECLIMSLKAKTHDDKPHEAVIIRIKHKELVPIGTVTAYRGTTGVEEN